MTSTAVTPSQARLAIRDPVLLLPVVVAAGLGVGWLGSRGHVSGQRIAVDLALAWSSVAVALVVLGRPRSRPTAWLLIATAITVLGADLEWAGSNALWTIGLMFEGLWAATLLLLVLTIFRDPSPLTRGVIAGAYLVAFGGQLIGAFVASDPRDVLAVASYPTVAHAIDRMQELGAAGLGLLVIFLILRHGYAVRGLTRRSQGPLLLATATTTSVGLAWLGWVIATDAHARGLETVARAVTLTIPLSIAGGIAWSRLRRSRASELVVDLRREAETTMRERLARALGDPTLDVAYRLADGRYVSADGRPIQLPDGNQQALTTVTAGGEEIAVLIHDPALLDDPALVESVRATAGLVLENERLAAQVRSRLAEVRRSRARIVEAADAERRRIERNLHDGAQQRLVTLSVGLALAASRADDASAEVLSRAQDEVEEAIGELRELARGIHPTLLREEGLATAVEALARRTPMPVTVLSNLSERLPAPVELAAYFVVSEALTNVVKHASATRATVKLTREATTTEIAVEDNGVGGARMTSESGLAGLRDRLEAIDATLSIESEPGAGTTVRAVFPCES
jgi:signal transduction histidine kinase